MPIRLKGSNVQTQYLNQMLLILDYQQFPTTALHVLLVISCNIPTSFLADAPPCPFYWNTFNGYCYLARSFAKSWQQAQAYCKARRGELVKITSAEENNFVLALARERAPSRKQVWMGLQWDSRIRSFVWFDYSLPVYKNWAPHEPNGNARQPCGSMWTGHAGNLGRASGYWNDFPCRVFRHWPVVFVCKRVP